MGVGGEGDHPSASIVGKRAGLLKLREQIDRALGLGEGMAAMNGLYREIDGSGFDLMVQRATGPEQMGEARELERPDRSMFT